MALQSNIPTWDGLVTGTIGVTTVTVAGPNVPCNGATYLTMPAAATTTVNVVDSTVGVGGIEMTASVTYGPIPCSNLSQLFFKGAAALGTGTVTINYSTHR